MNTKLLLLCLLISIPFVKVSPTNTDPLSGINPYKIVPQDITSQVRVTLPYYTTEKTTLEYSYAIYNGNGVKTHSQPTVSGLLLANTTLLINYSAKQGHLTLGSNRLVIRYKAAHHSNFINHTCYFYTYYKGVEVNLNDFKSAANLLKEEVVFEYAGYLKRTVTYSHTTLYSAGLDGYIPIEHDLYLDFNYVTFSMLNRYDDEYIGKGILYCEDSSLFPLFTVVNKHEVGFWIKVKNNKNRIYLVPDMKIFVDKETHLIDDSYKTGFYNTNNIFFPRSRLGTIDLTPFRFEIKDFGYHKFNLIYRFQLNVDTSFLGEGGLYEIMIERY